MSTEPPRPAFTMMGAADAAACEGDSCLLPSAVAVSSVEGSSDDDSIDIEPTREEAAAASARAVAAALDEGSSL